MDECDDDHIPSCMFDNITYMLSHMLSQLHHKEVFNQQNVEWLCRKLHLYWQGLIYFTWTWKFPFSPSLEGCKCYSITSLNLTHVFEYCVVRSGPKNIHHEDKCLKDVGLCLQFVLSILQPMINTIWGCPCTQLKKQHTHTHTLPMTITVSQETQILFRLLLMFHSIFANATHILRREYDQYKTENLGGG